MNRRSYWSSLRNNDRWLVAVLLPIWLGSLFLHFELAAGDALRAPAIVLASSSDDAYPLVSEILDGAGETAASAGVMIGDELLAVNARDLSAVSGFRAGVIAFSQLGHDRDVIATMRRGAAVFDTPFPFGQFPIPWWWPSLFAVSFGLVGLLVLVSAPASKTAQAVFPAFIAFALTWLFFPGKSETQTMIAGALYALSMVFAAPLVLRAILLLPDRSAIRSRSAYVAVWTFSLMAIFGTSAFIGVPFSAAFGQKAHLASISLFYLAILVVLARNYRSADMLGRRQLRWVILGFYLAFVPALLVSTIIIMFPEQFNLYALSSIGMPIIPLMFLIAIAKYNLFDIDRMIGGTISYSIMVVLVAVLAEAVVEPLVAGTGMQYGYDGNTVQIVFVAILTAVLIPAQRKWRPYIDRVFFADGVAVEESIEALIERLEEHEDSRPEDWIAIVGRDLAEVYRFDGWSVYAMGSDGPKVVLSEGKSTPGTMDETVWEKYARRIRPGSEKLANGHNYLIVPIRPWGSLRWLMVLGPKNSGDVYTTTDNGLIASVAHIVAGEIADHTVPA